MNIEEHPQRDFAIEVVKRLRAAGYVAYWAGGCVRDELLGKWPKDYDVATSATPEQVRTVFGRRKTLAVGASFGVIIVVGPRPAGQIDVATFREDRSYSDGRHPDAVCFSTPEKDAQRRDFTINGLFFDPVEEKVLDYVSGQEDLQRGVVRAIGVAEERIKEDKLRMLRAVRFTAVFGFELEEKTRQAICDLAKEIHVVSPERIGMELRSMLLHSQRAVALKWLEKVTLLPEVLPEVSQLAENEPTLWQTNLEILSQLSDPNAATALAGLLLPLGQAELGQEFAQRLRWTKKEGERAAWILQHADRMPNLINAPWPQAQRLLIAEGMEDLLNLYTAMTSPEDPVVQWCREKLAQPTEELNPPPLVTGGDLRKQGLSPGPAFKELLEGIRDAQLLGKITNQEEALQLAEDLLKDLDRR